MPSLLKQVETVSEGNGNLKEIADILLMMKQKDKHP